MGMATYDGYGSGTSATNNQVWYTWNTYSGSTTTSASSNTYVWRQWVTVSYETTTSTSTVYNDAIWQQWVETAPAVYERTVVEPARTPEVQPARYEEIEKKREVAEHKAIDLLLDLLGEEQTEIYKKTGKLVVKGEKHDWLIDKNGQVFRLEKDKVVQLCVHSIDRHKQPPTDNVIALALHAKFAEKKLLKEANFVRDRLDMLSLPEAANF